MRDKELTDMLSHERYIQLGCLFLENKLFKYTTLCKWHLKIL